MSENNNEDFSKTEKSNFRQDPAPTIIEWLVRGFGLVVIFGLLGYFIYGAIQSDTPPVFDCRVIVDKIERRGDGWVMPVDITNKGDIAVRTITAKIKKPVDYTIVLGMLGPRETAQVEFWFEEMPSAQYEVVVESYVLL